MASPLQILLDAQKAIPAMRYAGGVAGLGAVVAIIAGFQLDPRIAVFGVLIVVGLMFVLVIFAAFSRHSGRGMSYLALVAAWCFLLLTIATVGLLCSSFFFDWPRPLADLARSNQADQVPVNQDRSMYSWSELEPSQQAKISELMMKQGCIFFHILDSKSEMAPMPEAFRIFIAARLEQIAQPEISVSGFIPPDSDFSDAYAVALSERRASYVKAFLIQAFDVDAASITTYGYGKSRPVRRVGTYYCGASIDPAR